MDGKCDASCADCIYSFFVSERFLCEYYLATDKRRPCPAGEGCTVRKKRKKPRKKREKRETD